MVSSLIIWESSAKSSSNSEEEWSKSQYKTAPNTPPKWHARIGTIHQWLYPLNTFSPQPDTAWTFNMSINKNSKQYNESHIHTHEDPWCKVSSRVKGIWTVVSKTCSKSKDSTSNHSWKKQGMMQIFSNNYFCLFSWVNNLK